MNFCNKILWGMISGFICFVCRDVYAASCSLVILASKYLSAKVTNETSQLDFTACSNAGICYCNQYYCDTSQTNCAGVWRRSAEYTNVDTMLDEVSLCSGKVGFYISQCKNEAGTFFTPTAENIFECVSSFTCASCPSSGASPLMVQALLDGGVYHGNPFYLCGQTDPRGGTLDGIYMMEVQLQCAGGNPKSTYNHITQCYQQRDSTGMDSMGSYTWTSSCYYSE